MVVLWLLDAALALVEWLLGLLPEMGTLTLPAPLSLVAPVPLLAGGQIAALNTWAAAGLAVAGVLIASRVVVWLYEHIPFKAT